MIEANILVSAVFFLLFTLKVIRLFDFSRVFATRFQRPAGSPAEVVGPALRLGGFGVLQLCASDHTCRHGIDCFNTLYEGTMYMNAWSYPDLGLTSLPT